MPAASVDTISSLPDELLSHILSLLPTKESTATSVLSKRWTHVWHHVPDLHINVNTTESNLEFLYSLLLSRDAASSNSINTFNLDIHLVYILDFHNFTKCLDFLVQTRLRLKFLRLHFHHKCNQFLDRHECTKARPKLPFSIFTCKTLVSLSLRWFNADHFSFSSNRLCFPSLKILHFKYIKFWQFRDFMLLLAGSPILQDLSASRIFFNISTVLDYEVKSLSFPNLTRANLIQCGCSWSMFMVNAISTSVSLSIETYNLYIEDHIVSQINQQCLPNDIPIFHNLTHLELHDDWELVLKVLHLCPKLQNLVLYQELNQAISNETYWKEEMRMKPKFVPQCLLLCLRTCTIRDFLGLHCDIKLAKYILKNAKNLQTLSISRVKELPEIEKKLFACPKASPTCELSIIDN